MRVASLLNNFQNKQAPILLNGVRCNYNIQIDPVPLHLQSIKTLSEGCQLFVNWCTSPILGFAMNRHTYLSTNKAQVITFLLQHLVVVFQLSNVIVMMQRTVKVVSLNTFSQLISRLWLWHKENGTSRVIDERMQSFIYVWQEHAPHHSCSTSSSLSKASIYSLF